MWDALTARCLPVGDRASNRGGNLLMQQCPIAAIRGQSVEMSRVKIRGTVFDFCHKANHTSFVWN